MSICEKCYKKSVCKVTSPNMAGCIEFLPYSAVKAFWIKKMVKIAKMISATNESQPTSEGKI